MECFVIMCGDPPYQRIWQKHLFHRDLYDISNFEIVGPLSCKVYTFLSIAKCKILTKFTDHIQLNYIKWMENSFPTKEEAENFLNTEIDFKIKYLLSKIDELKNAKK